MNILHPVGHNLLAAAVASGYHQFIKDSRQLERVQRHQLRILLSQVAGTVAGRQLGVSEHWRWDDFTARVPVTSYPDWQDLIIRQRTSDQWQMIRSPVMRYQPTSGSSNAMKWIPYTSNFLQQLNQAISPWISDIYRRYRGVRQGSHYWSLSWLPDNMRGMTVGQLNDDLAVLSAGKRLLAGVTQAVPEKVSLLPSSEDALFATVATLASDRSLVVLSVWSPTFALMLFERMALWREELTQCLLTGHWGERRARLGSVRCPKSLHAAALLRCWHGEQSVGFFSQLWPNLALISAWDTGGSALWAERLCSVLPYAAFQGKGLWATEGVVTIPFQNQYPLACRSHVYEFEDLESGTLLPPWLLREGQTVMPVLTTGSGLLRYRLADRMRVNGFFNELPCLTFIGRDEGSDLVGEKLSAGDVLPIFYALTVSFACRPVTLLATRQTRDSGLPGYVLLAEQEGFRPVDEQAIAELLERSLCEIFHYRLARELGQLAPARVIVGHDMRATYLSLCRARGMIEGNIKLEPLTLFSGLLPEHLQRRLDAVFLAKAG